MHRFVAAVLVVALVGACRSGGTPGTSPATTTPSTEAAPAPAEGDNGSAPAPSPEAAVSSLLAAERDGDRGASYRLLSPPARQAMDQPTWSRRRSELPRVTGFRIESATGPEVVALVEHEPGLDPFIGLSPARERQTWRARQQAGGWLVDPEPLIEPQYPPADLAPAAALDWARAVQSCDEAKARDTQAVEVLFGRAEAAAGLCGSKAALAAGAATPVPSGPGTADLVAQYGAEALVWARAVPISGPQVGFSVVLAPIGSVWKVVGLFPS